jgi:hypothetical protein
MKYPILTFVPAKNSYLMVIPTQNRFSFADPPEFPKSGLCPGGIV